MSVITLMMGIVMLGMAYVVAPVAIEAYRRFRGVRTVACPVTGGPAEIELDAMLVAMTSATGRPVLRVARCSRWPECRDCGEGCRAQVERAA